MKYFRIVIRNPGLIYVKFQIYNYFKIFKA